MLRRLAVLPMVFAMAACGADSISPTAPKVDASAGLISSVGATVDGTLSAVTEVEVLDRKSTLSTSISASKTIGKLGGVIEIPQTGVRFVVPAGALDVPVNITMTAIQGKQVAYEFAPHGLKFNKPAELQQDLKPLTSLLGWMTLRGAYFEDQTKLNPLDGTALIKELIDGYTKGGTFFFPIKHFSGYLVSCG